MNESWHESSSFKVDNAFCCIFTLFLTNIADVRFLYVWKAEDASPLGDIGDDVCLKM